MDPSPETPLMSVLISGLLGALIGGITVLLATWWTLSFQRATAKMQFSTELINRFYHSTDKLFIDLGQTIYKCKKVLKNNGGTYDYTDLNNYLGFFEDLAFYYKKGFLDLDFIDHAWGQYIKEASINEEIHNYINDQRKREKRETIFAGFLDLANKIKILGAKETIAILSKNSNREEADEQ